jgi:hypothetical protein
MHDVKRGRFGEQLALLFQASSRSSPLPELEAESIDYLHDGVSSAKLPIRVGDDNITDVEALSTVLRLCDNPLSEAPHHATRSQHLLGLFGNLLSFSCNTFLHVPPHECRLRCEFVSANLFKSSLRCVIKPKMVTVLVLVVHS